MSRGPSSLRARRWDVLVLGGALRGLVAAVRLARAGQRVLVVEEEAAARQPALLREPFLLPGPASESVLDPCLRALGLAPVERRAFETDALSHQVLLPDVRLDVGAATTADEWVTWGLAKPEEAAELARGLEAGARAALGAMLRSAVVRAGRSWGLGRRRADPTRAPVDWEAPQSLAPMDQGGSRGWPALGNRVGAALERVFAAEVRALSSRATAPPSSEERVRLVGASLCGGSAFHREGLALHSLLRRRLEKLHAEFRTVARPFRMVRIGDHPGIAVDSADPWLGRALIVNAWPARLGAALREWGRDVPELLRGPVPTHRRLAVHLRALAEVVPEGLARRAILVREAPASGDIALSLHASPRGPQLVEIVARIVVPDLPERLEAVAEEVERAVSALMPFSAGKLARGPLPPRPLWDDELALADAGEAERGEISIRPGRAPIYVLPGETMAGYGVEGDLLFGWRAGDAISEELG